MLIAHALRKTLPGTPPRLLFDELELQVGAGECVAIVGESPVMQVLLVTRTDEDAFNTDVVFGTVVAPLTNATPREKFVF